MPINLANKNKRDANVALLSVKEKSAAKFIDTSGLLTYKVRLLKSSLPYQLESLVEAYGSLDHLARGLLEEDPELDIESFGRYLKETSRVYYADGSIVFHVNEVEVVFNTDGIEQERKTRDIKTQNINTDIPIQWTNKFIKKSDAVRSFVFTNTKQISHINGLTFDFLFEMASELAEKKSLMLVGGGKKGNEPIVFNRGGKGYRGFLEGRIDGDKYMLLMHLSNMELKLPEETE